MQIASNLHVYQGSKISSRPYPAGVRNQKIQKDSSLEERSCCESAGNKICSLCLHKLKHRTRVRNLYDAMTYQCCKLAQVLTYASLARVRWSVLPRVMPTNPKGDFTRYTWEIWWNMLLVSAVAHHAPLALVRRAMNKINVLVLSKMNTACEKRSKTCMQLTFIMKNPVTYACGTPFRKTM